MIIKKLKLINFRNYEKLEKEFSEGINLIFGKNGVGKTSIIEAIYFLGNLSSFRTNNEKSLIKKEEQYGSIEGITKNKTFSIVLNKGRKVLKINDIEFPKYREYLGKLNVVGFCPEDVLLFKDSPKERREFIDKEISKINNQYLVSLIQYNNLLKERNKVLKTDDKFKKKLISIMDNKLAELQSKIVIERRTFIEKLKNELIKITKEFDYKYDVNIVYDTFVKETEYENIKEEVIKIYEKNYELDSENKVTSQGIHRDDWGVVINEFGIKDFASQGEQRLMILMLKLSLVEIIKRETKQEPILVLDDVLFELDHPSKLKLIKFLKQLKQTFITSCDYEEYKEISKEMTIYKI